jgi:uncharacterized protein YjbI with pentapeptide repeats
MFYKVDRVPQPARRTHLRGLLTMLACTAFAQGFGLAALAPTALAQDMTQYLDLKSDEFTKADLTRADVEALIAARKASTRIDLQAKRLNKLDLSGLDLSNANLQSARINGTDLSKAKLDGAVLDQAWGLDADLTGASLKGASLFATQLMGAKVDGADLSNSRIAADFSRASLKGAKFDHADLSADMKNQSMGLMRGVFKSADLEHASFRDANLARVVLDYAQLDNADLTGANLMGSELGGANLTGANVTGANFSGADVNSARLLKLTGRDTATGLASAKNLDRAFTD